MNQRIRRMYHAQRNRRNILQIGCLAILAIFLPIIAIAVIANPSGVLGALGGAGALAIIGGAITPSDSIADLQQEKATLVDETRSILDTAGDKPLEGDPLTNYEQRCERIEQINLQIGRYEKQRSYELELAKQHAGHRGDGDPKPQSLQGDQLRGNPAPKHTGDRFDSDQYRASFEAWLLTGQNVGGNVQFGTFQEEETRALAGLRGRLVDAGVPEDQLRALDLSTNPGGGAIVPTQFRDRVITELKVGNILRSLATVISTSNTEKLPIENGTVTVGWRAVNAAVSDSDPDFAQKTLDAFSMAGLSKQPIELLADSNIDLLGFIAAQFGEQMGITEAAAMIDGDGTNKPTGLLSNTDVNTHEFASNSAWSFDDIIDIEYALPVAYRRRARAAGANGATFLTHSNTEKALRKLKDGDNNYIWIQGNVERNVPDRLNGYTLVTDDNMESIGASKKTIVFGDFMRGYTIGDRGAMMLQRLNELFAANLQHGLLTWKRVDGIVTDHKALVLGSHPA